MTGPSSGKERPRRQKRARARPPTTGEDASTDQPSICRNGGTRDERQKPGTLIRFPRLKAFLSVFPISDTAWGLRGGADEVWRIKLTDERSVHAFGRAASRISTAGPRPTRFSDRSRPRASTRRPRPPSCGSSKSSSLIEEADEQRPVRRRAAPVRRSDPLLFPVHPAGRSEAPVGAARRAAWRCSPTARWARACMAGWPAPDSAR